MTLTIRPYSAADRAACHTVYFNAVHIGAADSYTPAQRAAWAPNPHPDQTKTDRLLNQFTLVAEIKNQIVGFMSLDHTGYLDMGFVLPDHMGQGVAPALHTAILDIACHHQMHRLTVNASHLARRFLAKHGWQLGAAEHYAINDQHLERFAMTLNLAAP